jgi:hypothetical protein
MVRRRTAADEWPAVPQLNAVRGAFCNGDNEIRLALPVTAEVVRGSGQAIHPAVAAAVEVAPGERRMFASPHGEVTVFWKLSSTSGANVGSLQAQAVAVEATTADTLVLAFGRDDASLEVSRLGPEEAALRRLVHLLGHAVRNPAAALAASLGCRRSDVPRSCAPAGMVIWQPCWTPPGHEYACGGGPVACHGLWCGKRLHPGSTLSTPRRRSGRPGGEQQRGRSRRSPIPVRGPRGPVRHRAAIRAQGRNADLRRDAGLPGRRPWAG